MGVLLTVVPAVSCFFLFLGLLVIEYGWGGIDDVREALSDWTRPSPFLANSWSRLVIGVMALASFGVPVLFWYRIFVSSGFISAETNHGIERGQLPVIGGFWKPLMYTGYFTGCAVGAWLSFQQHSNAGIILFGVGGLWLLTRGARELLAWWRRK